MTDQHRLLEQEGRPSLAYHYLPANPALPGAAFPTLIFLPGFRSDMEGTKALYLDTQCRMRGQAYIRFDYSGHGRSAGRFEDGTIGAWTQDALDIIDHIAPGPVLLAGSSMGGWIALNCALRRTERVRGVVGIAAAPDFTRQIRLSLTQAQQEMLDSQGYIEEETEYDDRPYYFSRALLTEGDEYCLLTGALDLDRPVRLVQGMQDADVPWQTAHHIRKALEECAHMAGRKADIDIFLVEEGDHRLSRPEDLALIDAQIRLLSAGKG